MSDADKGTHVSFGTATKMSMAHSRSKSCRKNERDGVRRPRAKSPAGECGGKDQVSLKALYAKNSRSGIFDLFDFTSSHYKVSVP